MLLALHLFFQGGVAKLCDIEFEHQDRVSQILGMSLPSVVSDLAIDGSV